MPIAGVEDALGDGAVPFFIQRDPGAAISGAEGSHGGIVGVEVGCAPEAVAGLARWSRTARRLSARREQTAQDDSRVRRDPPARVEQNHHVTVR